MRAFLIHFAVLAALAPGARAGTWQPGHYAGLFGQRDYSVYVPSSTPHPRGLLLFLHGCNQTPEEFAQGARVAQAAEARGLLVLLPKQDHAYNPEGCWNWFLPVNQRREMGEAGLLADLTRQVLEQRRVDRDQVFVAGLSAGAAMTGILALCYPDLYAASAIHSGMGYLAASDPATALWSVGHGSAADPAFAATQAYGCAGVFARPRPMLLIQGTADTRVVPLNAAQIRDEFSFYDEWADDGLWDGSFAWDAPRIESGQVPAGHAYSVRRDFADGRLWIESVTVNGMAHAWSGGDPAIARTDPQGPDFTSIMMDFFLKETR